LNTEGPLLAATLPFKGNSIPNNTLSKTAEPVKLNKNEKREKKKKKYNSISMVVVTRLYSCYTRRVAALFSPPSGLIQAGVHPPEYSIPNLWRPLGKAESLVLVS
jgi:hypothetical protein